MLLVSQLLIAEHDSMEMLTLLVFSDGPVNGIGMSSIRHAKVGSLTFFVL